MKENTETVDFSTTAQTEEINSLNFLTKLFEKLRERILKIKENEGELSYEVLFDFNKIYKEEKDNISILTDEECADSYGNNMIVKKKIKVKKLK